MEKFLLKNTFSFRFNIIFFILFGFSYTGFISEALGNTVSTENDELCESLDIFQVTSENLPMLDVENLDRFPSNDQLVFSRIQIPWARKPEGATSFIYNENHDVVTIRIWNKGAAPLTINEVTISNENLWIIETLNKNPYNPGSFPLNLNTRQNIELTIRFVAKDQASRVKILHETLTIKSNDPTHPNKIVYLNGLWQLRGEDRWEPTTQEMFDAFGFKTKSGWPNMPDPDKGDPNKPVKGDEIRSAYFTRADNTKPVYVRQLAAYHGCCLTTETFRYNTKGTKNRTNIVVHRREDGQTLFPKIPNGSNFAESSFVPNVEVFGFNVNNDYTDPALNIYPNYPGDNNKIGVKAWKVIDAEGKVVPNAYILANDYLGTQYTNYDYNDNVYYVSNIKPEIGTVHYSELAASPSALNFGESALNATKKLPVNISNLGKTSYSNGSSDPAVEIKSVKIIGQNSDEFSVSALPTKINPQASANIEVSFNPKSEGFRNVELLIEYNVAISPLRIPIYAIATDGCKEGIAVYSIKSGMDTDVTVNGKTWVSDKNFRKGNVQLDKPNVTSIASTDDDEVYINYLSSKADLNIIRYEIPVENGEYMVRLHFSENFFTLPGSRVFTISMEDQIKIANFDILREVKPRTALVKDIPVNVADEVLNINFTPTVNRLSLAAVEVYSIKTGAGIHLTTKANNASCGLANGSIEASSANNAEATYRLGSEGSFQASGNFNNLMPGTYTVFARNSANSCITSTEVTIEDDGCPNNPPILNQPINDQAAKEGASFNFSFPINTFIDNDQGDVLTYSASLSNNGDLPLWLTFNAATRTFSGTPESTDVGTIEIKVTATDKQGESVSATFKITVAGKNDPFISEIPDQVTQQDTPLGPIEFTIDAGDQQIADLTLSAESGNEDVIVSENVAISGTGTDRSVTITPNSGKYGVTVITITLKGDNTETHRKFKVSVLKNVDFPKISEIDDVTTSINTITEPIEFTVEDDGNLDDLIITAESDNKELIPDANIIFIGSGSSRALIITPAEGQTGTATITVQVYNGESMATTTFKVHVTPITSVVNEAVISKISLYPNPAAYHLTLSIENRVKGKAEIVVMDTKGKILQVFNIDKANEQIEYTLSIENLSAGSYILKIQQADTVNFKRFIKQ